MEKKLSDGFVNRIAKKAYHTEFWTESNKEKADKLYIKCNG